ncbi:MAG: response regulator [Bacteroidota bacterium]
MLRKLTFLQYFLLLVVPLTVVILAGGWMVADAGFQRLLSSREASEMSGVALGANALGRRLSSVADDVEFLSKLPRLQDAMNSGDEATLRRLTETFEMFVTAKTHYNKLRWIDVHGMERIRVDYDWRSKQIKVVPARELQNKAGRYFFQDAMRVEPGELYLSPFDLNVEHDEIERPLNPTLRMATSLVDREGHRRGIIILNLRGDDLVKRMLLAAGNMEHIGVRLSLVNHKGYWLHAPRPDDEWGFQLGQPEKALARSQPGVWAQMQASPSGQAVRHDGLWTWRRVQPLVDIRNDMSQAGAAMQVNADRYIWYVVANQSAESLAALRMDAWRALAWPLPTVIVIGMIACAALTRYRGQVISLESAQRQRLDEAEAANHRLGAQERFIRAITDHLPSKISYWDAGLHCRYINAAYAAWFGRPEAELVGMSLKDAMGEASFREHQASIRAVQAGQIKRFERKVRRTDGSVAYLLTDFIPELVDGRVEGFYVLATDVTELKQAGFKLSELNAELSRRIDEVMAASRAKDDFLSNMSHEIRTPLNAILGLAYLLDNRSLTPEDKDLVRKIRGSGRMLLGIICDILDYSKIEAGRLELEHTPFRLSDVLDGVAAIMSTTAGDKEIELTIDTVPAGAECLYGDALRLGQVLNNLISNAIKFTEHGAVSLHVGFTEGPEVARRLRFSVTDTGIGIPPDKQEQIFDAFSQADTSTTRRFGGTGLGLSISRHLVQRMGGELKVTSEVGKGSEFWFSLPFQAAPNDYSTPGMAMQRVLIVDDSMIARDSLSAIAHSLGWHAETADSGDAAITRWQSQAATGRPFDVALIDWLIPGMDGIAIADAIRANCAGTDVKPIIVMVTAHTSELMRQRQELTIVDLVLSKPVTASILFNGIAEAKRRSGQPGLLREGGTRGKRLPGLRVMVVDDSEINCEVAARILESEGARVQTLSDGAAAVDWLRQWPDLIDVVLMDVQMPLMDGYETTRRIRAELQGNELPIIALTAGAFSYQRDAALGAGMNDFLSKPFDVNTMVATLQRWTGVRPMQLPSPEAEPEKAPDPVTAALSSVLRNLPGIDLERGLAAWGKDVAGYRKYLRRFADSYAGAGRQIAESARSGDREGAAALAHKLAGAAGNLGLPDVERLARAADAELHAGRPFQPHAEALQEAIDIVLGSLESWQEADAEAPAAGSLAEINNPAVASLLRELLAALDRDSPRHAEPLLAELAAYLPAEMLAGIREHIDAFDFRGGEARVRDLAAGLGITWE